MGQLLVQALNPSWTLPLPPWLDLYLGLPLALPLRMPVPVAVASLNPKLDSVPYTPPLVYLPNML